MSIYENGEAKPCVDVHKYMYTKGVWEHAPLGKISETASAVFSGTL